MPKMVSVVMITYGHEHFIEQAIQGVLMQQCNFNIELIIANDRSPDATHEVVKEIIAHTNLPHNITIDYTCHELNLGMMPNFIWALKKAKGKYIALCEGDDFWTEPTKLQQQVDFLEAHPDYIMCCHDRNVVDDKNNVLIYNQQTTKQDKDTFVQSLVYRNATFDTMFYDYFVKAKNGDTFLIYKLHKLGKTHYFDFNGACYRESAAGVWSQVGEQKRFDMSMDSYDNMIAYYTVLKDTVSIEELQKWKAEQFLIRSKSCHENGFRKQALYNLLQYNRAIWKHNRRLFFNVNNMKSNIVLTLQYLFK